MRLFLQIDMGDWKTRSYHNPLVAYASSRAADLMGTDIDNQSESGVIDLVLKLVEQADFVFVLVVAAPGGQPGSVEKMFSYLLQHKNKVDKLVLLGENESIKIMETGFQERFIAVTDSNEVKKMIRDFA